MLRHAQESTARPGWGAGGPQVSGVELLSVKQTARLINASQRTVYRMAEAGRMPPPVKLGALVRWRRAELEAWIAAGCPAVAGASADERGAPR